MLSVQFLLGDGHESVSPPFFVHLVTEKVVECPVDLVIPIGHNLVASGVSAQRTT